MAVPMIHQTDLFHPHNDPDDHYDLACVFALAAAGRLDLKAVLIDHPPENMPGDPDIAAVSQLNHITGLAVPAVVGSALPVRFTGDALGDSPAQATRGVDTVLDILRRSAEPVVINIVGSCRDIAVAGARDPELFRRKCAGIYLNAGTGSPEPGKDDRLEYNVSLNPAAYASVFDIPCPIYWLPCFETFPAQLHDRTIMEFGSFYSFRQDDILPHLPDRMQRYFAYMLERSGDMNWLRYLEEPPDPETMSRHGLQDRLMWCTAGFFHAAGLDIIAAGGIIPQNESADSAVFEFLRADVECGGDGVTRWKPAAAGESRDRPARYIFRVRDISAYPAAMTAAMKTLLCSGQAL